MSAVLELGIGLVLTPRILLTARAGIGVTDEAPDLQFGMSVPIRF